MKNLPYITQGILFVLIVGLYILHFSESKSEPVEEANSSTTEETITNIEETESEEAFIVDTSAPTEMLEGNIAYVQYTALVERFKYFKRENEKLDARLRSAEEDVRKKQIALQQEAMAAQQAFAAMTPEQQQQSQQMLMEKSQELEKKRLDLEAQSQNAMSSLLKQREKANKNLQSKMQSFFTEYCEENNLDFVLGYAPENGTLLYGKKGFDRTEEIIKLLNQKYP